MQPVIIRFIKQSLQPFKYWIIGLWFVSLIWAIDLSLTPYLLKTIINKIPHLSTAEVVQQLLGPISLYLGFSLLTMTMTRLDDYIWLKFNAPLKRHLVHTLMQKMMSHSLIVFQNHFAGNLANQIKDVMNGIPTLLRVIVLVFTSRMMALVIAIFTVWSIHYKFALLLVTWIAIFILVNSLFAKRVKQLAETTAKAKSYIVGQIVDILSNIATVHLFAGKKIESDGLNKHLDHYVVVNQRRDWWFLGLFSFQGFSFLIYQAIGFIFLVIGFKDGTVTGGDFALLVGINVGLITSLWTLSYDIMNFSELIGEIKQGLRVALAPYDIQDQPDAKQLHVSRGGITFQDIKFHYKGTKPLFEHLSVQIEPGQKVGLVGYSGSGKTTFANLLLRLYDVNEGKILIDGQDIRSVTQDSLHKHLAMVPQDPSLFHRSLMDNIRYGRIEASDEAVVAAAKKAHAHDFISQLPQGYDSLVGERGIKLSGGQRQRIAMARAMLNNAPILILDEATSQLDSLTEMVIQDSLWKEMEGKTTLVIAHRLSTLMHMDRILVFEQGEIVESGAHHELLARNGLYKQLWDSQVGGFLPDTKEVTR